MSGGVDSSVAAALLKDAGHDVVGVTLQLYDQGARVTRPGGCCAGRDIQDARRVAEHLGIPHYVLDYEDRFAREVIRPFARSYLDGETPIPCVLCNQQIKFTDLLETARELGAEALATGHYVQVRQGPSGAELLRGRDDDRDQSYFLFSTTREQLGFLRFPLGGMRKPEVRALAQTYGITVAEKPDSQDICFVPDGRYASVIEKLHPEAVEGGDIVHVDGRVLGRHKGIVHYTIGQRRGLGVASGEPMFVVRLDPALRRVVVGPRSALRADRIVLRDMNWLGDGALESLVDGMSVNVRIRSSQVPRPARLFPGEAGTRSAYVVVEDGEYGVSPGQACVVYADDGAEARVLGGGWIEAAFSDAADGAVPEGRLRPERRALG